jgi:hypothetical protein
MCYKTLFFLLYETIDDGKSQNLNLKCQKQENFVFSQQHQEHKFLYIMYILVKPFLKQATTVKL